MTQPDQYPALKTNALYKASGHGPSRLLWKNREAWCEWVMGLTSHERETASSDGDLFSFSSLLYQQFGAAAQLNGFARTQSSITLLTEEEKDMTIIDKVFRRRINVLALPWSIQGKWCWSLCDWQASFHWQVSQWSLMKNKHCAHTVDQLNKALLCRYTRANKLHRVL